MIYFKIATLLLWFTLITIVVLENYKCIFRGKHKQFMDVTQWLVIASIIATFVCLGDDIINWFIHCYLKGGC